MREKKGYVYIAEDTPDICKIGITCYFPSKRIEHLSTKYHRDFILRGYFVSENMLRDEEIIHQTLRSYHMRGEWFHLSYIEIKKILQKDFEFKDFQNESDFIGYQLKMPIEFFQCLEELLETASEEDKQKWMREKLIKYLVQMTKKKNECEVMKVIKGGTSCSISEIDEDWR